MIAGSGSESDSAAQWLLDLSLVFTVGRTDTGDILELSDPTWSLLSSQDSPVFVTEISREKVGQRLETAATQYLGNTDSILRKRKRDKHFVRSL